MNKKLCFSVTVGYNGSIKIMQHIFNTKPFSFYKISFNSVVNASKPESARQEVIHSSFLNFNATKSRVLTYKIPFSDNPEYDHQGAEISVM